MNVEPNYALAFGSYTEPATLLPKRELTINLKRENTNQTDISIKLRCLTSGLGYLDDTTTEIMQHMLTYHDVPINSASTIVEATSNHVYTIVSQLSDFQRTDLHVIVNITDFNPRAIHRIDVDIATINQEAAVRAPSTNEEDELCTICYAEIGRGCLVNSLECNHVFHHQCIANWIRFNLRCPTCRLAII